MVIFHVDDAGMSYDSNVGAIRAIEDGVAIMLKNIDYWRDAPVWTVEVEMVPLAGDWAQGPASQGSRFAMAEGLRMRGPPECKRFVQSCPLSHGVGRGDRRSAEPSCRILPAKRAPGCGRVGRRRTSLPVTAAGRACRTR